MARYDITNIEDSDILVGVDGSASAKTALRWALAHVPIAKHLARAEEKQRERARLYLAFAEFRRPRRGHRSRHGPG